MAFPAIFPPQTGSCNDPSSLLISDSRLNRRHELSIFWWILATFFFSSWIFHFFHAGFRGRHYRGTFAGLSPTSSPLLSIPSVKGTCEGTADNDGVESINVMGEKAGEMRFLCTLPVLDKSAVDPTTAETSTTSKTGRTRRKTALYPLKKKNYTVLEWMAITLTPNLTWSSSLRRGVNQLSISGDLFTATSSAKPFTAPFHLTPFSAHSSSVSRSLLPPFHPFLNKNAFSPWGGYAFAFPVVNLQTDFLLRTFPKKDNIQRLAFNALARCRISPGSRMDSGSDQSFSLLSRPPSHFPDTGLKYQSSDYFRFFYGTNGSFIRGIPLHHENLIPKLWPSMKITSSVRECLIDRSTKYC